MSSIAFWIGVTTFTLGAIFGLLSAIRTLQTSRRWSDYRLRRRYIVQARGSVVLALLSGGLAAALFLLARPSGSGGVPAALPPLPTSTEQATASPLATEAPTQAATETAPQPTDTPIVPSPVVFPSAAPPTATPVMPIAVQALVQGTATPAFDVEFGRLRFSTEINNYTLVAPGDSFVNPIKQMYSVFTYQPLGVKVEWIALWYQNGELKYVDTTSWKDFPAGVGVAGWTRPAPEWQAGNYEVQLFVGTDWQASGRFALEGDPPTPSPTPLPSATPTIAPTSTPSRTATATRTSTSSPIPPPSRTPSPTPPPTVTPAPSATPSPVPSPIRAATQPPTATRPAPSATPQPSSTATRVPTQTPSTTPSATITPTLAPITLDIYFNRKSASGTAAEMEVVRREVPGTKDVMAAALDQYFAGPTVQEQGRGLELTRNGFAGYRRIEIANGVVSVYLGGNCSPSGSGNSLAQPLIATLHQFPGVLHVKLYDAYDHTGNASSAADSWPLCLDVIFTPTRTALPTHTPTPTPSRTPPATSTPLPTSTSSPLPTSTRTPIPSATSTALPTVTSTRTPVPTATRTPPPSRTPTAPPTATFTRTPLPTLTASLTFTPGPTWTPRPTLTLTPINAPTKPSSGTSQPATPSGPTPTLDAACNHAEFLGDVTIVDNATVRPGEPFRKTWRVLNAGNCTWTAGYRLVFVRGEQMGGPDAISLPAFVAPGQSADISVDLVAPTTLGEYGGFWQLQTPGGTTFGLGPGASGSLWVQIRVAGQPIITSTATRSATLSPQPSPTGWAEATLTAFVATQTAAVAPTRTAAVTGSAAEVESLAQTACGAQWQANDGILGCPGSEGDPRGLVAVLGQARQEDGAVVTAPTLLTIPSAAQDGYILGLYPQYQVKSGDHFRAGVGCEVGAQLCSVLFRVSYLDTTGAAHDLWTVGEFLDGHQVDLDLDLTELAGQQIRLVLSVSNLGDSAGDRALWVAPRIINIPGATGPAQPTARPASTLSATATRSASPTPAAPVASLTAVPPTATPTPKPPIPQFFDLLVQFFRQPFSPR